MSPAGRRVHRQCAIVRRERSDGCEIHDDGRDVARGNTTYRTHTDVRLLYIIINVINISIIFSVSLVVLSLVGATY